MKKISFMTGLILVLAFPLFTVHAQSSGQSFNTVIGQFNVPDFLKPLVSQGPLGVSTVLSNIVALIFAISAVAAVFMVILGAFQWITSGGEKEHVAKARSRITHAILGIILLALAFFILNVIGQLIHFNFTNPSSSTGGTSNSCPAGTSELGDGRGCENSGVVITCFSGYKPNSSKTDCI